MVSTTPGVRNLLKGAAALALVASVLHMINAPEHFSDWWGYGFFFLLSSGAQLLEALGLWIMAASAKPFQLDPSPAEWQADPRSFALLMIRPRAYLWLGIIGNLAVALLYLVTRTVGIPFVGPDAGAIEPWNVEGLLAVACEIGIAALSWPAFRSPQEPAVAPTAPAPAGLAQGSEAEPKARA
ncbi:MAG: hypothetical protein ACYDDF_13970 [Thermoplasmatota archaeon]